MAEKGAAEAVLTLSDKAKAIGVTARKNSTFQIATVIAAMRNDADIESVLKSAGKRTRQNGKRIYDAYLGSTAVATTAGSQTLRDSKAAAFNDIRLVTALSAHIVAPDFAKGVDASVLADYVLRYTVGGKDYDFPLLPISNFPVGNAAATGEGPAPQGGGYKAIRGGVRLDNLPLVPIAPGDEWSLELVYNGTSPTITPGVKLKIFEESIEIVSVKN